VTGLRLAAQRTFRALAVRNYRLYFIGQVISVSGTWMQTVAQGWLVLRLTGSGVDLGLVTALQFLPMLLFGSWGGVVADRVNKRRMLFATQGSAAVLALVLGILDASGTVHIWEVYLLATLLGVVNLFDNPVRQTFVFEMAGHELLPNAVSLNSVLMNSARVIGPAVAGVLIATVGISVCFLVNAGSYVAVIVALALMRSRELHRRPPVPRAKGQVREGLRYVWSEPALRDPLLVMAVVGVFAFNFQTTLPLVARYTFGSGAGTYGALTAAMGAGAVVGGLVVAHRSKPSISALSIIGLAFGTLIAAVAISPDVPAALVLLVPMGAASIAFIATANASLQLTANSEMRGRVMALYAIAFLGSTPIGAPIVGAVSTASNPRVALMLGAVATLLASGVLAMRVRRDRQVRSASPEGAARRGEATTPELAGGTDQAEGALGSLGRPSTRSPTMLR
jgi:MFS family permease